MEDIPKEFAGMAKYFVYIFLFIGKQDLDF